MVPYAKEHKKQKWKKSFILGPRNNQKKWNIFEPVFYLFTEIRFDQSKGYI